MWPFHMIDFIHKHQAYFQYFTPSSRKCMKNVEKINSHIQLSLIYSSPSYFTKFNFLSALSSSRSPSMRRMRQILDLDSVRTGAPSPVPTPSGTLPRGQRQLDINPAEFLKYKIDKPGMVGGTSISGTYFISSGKTVRASIFYVAVKSFWIRLIFIRGYIRSNNEEYLNLSPPPRINPLCPMAESASCKYRRYLLWSSSFSTAQGGIFRQRTPKMIYYPRRDLVRQACFHCQCLGFRDEYWVEICVNF